jgi:hypothetical protein
LSNYYDFDSVISDNAGRILHYIVHIQKECNITKTSDVFLRGPDFTLPDFDVNGSSITSQKGVLRTGLKLSI